jgi:predicted lipid-binding transport protein (Tim44 family)
MIVEAFAKGDAAALRPLLGEDVHRAFATAIAQRQAAGETLETRILRLDEADIVRAGVDGRTVRVTVKFVSRQINVTRAKDGSIVDGDPEHPSEKTDTWTFARDTRSADPNWLLVATGGA